MNADTGGRLVRDPARRLAAEAGGTMVLLMAVVGSGIATSVDGAASTQLFQHAAVVGAVLAVLIWTLGPVSDAHFNPAVTLAAVITGSMSTRLGAAYGVAQVGGAIFFTSSMSFANPAVSIARMFTDTWTGIVAAHVPA